MGTSMAFYLIENRGFTVEDLMEKVAAVEKKASRKEKAQAEILHKMIQASLSEEQQRAWRAFQREIEQGKIKQARERRKTALAYRPDAKWLPLFEENLCEGYNASSRDTEKLAKTFGVPVLAFSIFDSDILFVSYSDPEKNIREDYAKPNLEGFEEYDMDQYREEFPAFLCAYGDEAALREAWEGREVYADDRMKKLCKIIGAQVLYDSQELPQGFQWVE